MNLNLVSLCKIVIRPFLTFYGMDYLTGKKDFLWKVYLINSKIYLIIKIILKFDMCLQILLISNDRSIVHFCRRGATELIIYEEYAVFKISKEFDTVLQKLKHLFLCGNNLHHRYFLWIFQNFQEAILKNTAERLLPYIFYIFSVY